LTDKTTSIPNISYDRYAIGGNYGYITTIPDTTSFFPEGLSVINEFKSSNVGSWTLFGSKYVPTDSKIGADSTNNTTAYLGAIDITFNNFSNRSYFVYMDVSTSSSTFLIQYSTDGTTWTNANANTQTFHISAYNKVLIPSGYATRFISYGLSNNYYFSGWYLEDIGISQSYELGFDTDAYAEGYSDGLGNNPNVLITAFESLIGMMVNFTFILFTLEMFGVSILSIVGVLFGLITIVWILKTIRG
jgi:hypothetical protein